MKYTLITFILIFSMNSFAQIRAGVRVRKTKKSRILNCLGKEEEYYHKNSLRGIFYDVNQMMMSEILMLSNADLKIDYFKSVCRNYKNAPALKLFKLILFKKNIFKFSGIDQVKTNQNLATLKELRSKRFELFSKFLTSLQLKSPTADCITKNIPEVIRYNDNIRYLATDLSGNQLFDEKLARRILTKTQKMKSFIKTCKKRKLSMNR
jgi:hypothetical protein